MYASLRRNSRSRGPLRAHERAPLWPLGANGGAACKVRRNACSAVSSVSCYDIRHATCDIHRLASEPMRIERSNYRCACERAPRERAFSGAVSRTARYPARHSIHHGVRACARTRTRACTPRRIDHRDSEHAAREQCRRVVRVCRPARRRRRVHHQRHRDLLARTRRRARVALPKDARMACVRACVHVWVVACVCARMFVSAAVCWRGGAASAGLGVG